MVRSRWAPSPMEGKGVREGQRMAIGQEAPQAADEVITPWCHAKPPPPPHCDMVCLQALAAGSQPYRSPPPPFSIKIVVLGRRRSSSHRDSHWGAAAPSDTATRHNDVVQGTALDGPLDPRPMETAPQPPLDAPQLPERAANFLAGGVRGKAKHQARGRQPPQFFSQGGDQHRPEQHNEVYTCIEFFAGGPTGSQRDA